MIITFNDVYRTGSDNPPITPTGTPVAAYYVCDTEVEVATIVSPAQGDLAYSKDKKVLYFWNGTAWAQVDRVTSTIVFTPDSRYFPPQGAMLFTPVNVVNSYRYEISGDKITISIFANGNITGTPNNLIYIYSPATVYKAYYYEIAAASCNNPSGIISPCRAYSIPDQSYIAFEKMDGVFSLGYIDICIQMHYRFYL